MTDKIIAIASDHGGFELKKELSRYLEKMGWHAKDLGTYGLEAVDYPDRADEMARWISFNPEKMGILICGSGIGMSIAANRYRLIRAALCNDSTSASLARKHNNANVLCLGARLISSETAKECVDSFLNSEFEGGRHVARVEKLSNFVKRESK
jgi:ribose 5-phosphate isomerase B